jgi:hypothetical protein
MDIDRLLQEMPEVGSRQPQTSQEHRSLFRPHSRHTESQDTDIYNPREFIETDPRIGSPTPSLESRRGIGSPTSSLDTTQSPEVIFESQFLAEEQEQEEEAAEQEEASDTEEEDEVPHGYEEVGKWALAGSKYTGPYFQNQNYSMMRHANGTSALRTALYLEGHELIPTARALRQFVAKEVSCDLLVENKFLQKFYREPEYTTIAQCYNDLMRQGFPWKPQHLALACIVVGYFPVMIDMIDKENKNKDALLCSVLRLYSVRAFAPPLNRYLIFDCRKRFDGSYFFGVIGRHNTPGRGLDPAAPNELPDDLLASQVLKCKTALRFDTDVEIVQHQDAEAARLMTVHPRNRRLLYELPFRRHGPVLILWPGRVGESLRAKKNIGLALYHLSFHELHRGESTSMRVLVKAENVHDYLRFGFLFGSVAWPDNLNAQTSLIERFLINPAELDDHLARPDKSALKHYAEIDDQQNVLLRLVRPLAGTSDRLPLRPGTY